MTVQLWSASECSNINLLQLWISDKLWDAKRHLNVSRNNSVLYLEPHLCLQRNESSSVSFSSSVKKLVAGGRCWCMSRKILCFSFIGVCFKAVKLLVVYYRSQTIKINKMHMWAKHISDHAPCIYLASAYWMCPIDTNVMINRSLSLRGLAFSTNVSHRLLSYIKSIILHIYLWVKVHVSLCDL